MKTKDFFNKISELDLKENFDMNRGGCGYFALIAIEYMPHLSIAYLCDCEKDRVNARDGHPDSCSHVALTDGDMYYDCTGVLHPVYVKDEYDSVEIVTKKHLAKSLKIDGAWNYKFDRKRLPVIKKSIANVVKQLKVYEDADRLQRKINF